MRLSKLTVILMSFLIYIMIFNGVQADVIQVPADESTIQGAINVSKDYDTILVMPGTYYETLNYDGKAVVVKSSDGPLQTIITNDPSVDLVVFTNDETSASVLQGFTLLGGRIGVLCENAGPTIKGNILRDQNITNWGAISLGGDGYATIGNSPAVIINNTITGCANGGISTFSSTSPTYKNNIVAFNGHYGFHRHSPVEAVTPHPIMSYNCAFGNPENYQNISELGAGYVHSNPLFYSDFSLQYSSPCIDAGDPDPAYNDPDGSRNDMGAVPYDNSGPTGPIVLHVPSEYATIQLAVDACYNGDTVLVDDGEYAENVDFNGKSIVLLSVNGAGLTSIVAPSGSIAFRLPDDFDSTMYSADTTDYKMAAEQSAGTEVLNISGSSSSTVVSGFTIDGGNAVRGIFGLNSSAEISNCIIQNCFGPYDGGGVFFEHGAPAIKYNTFRNNETPISGGAVFIRLGTGLGTAEIIGNVMHNNISGNGPAVSLIEGDDALVLQNVCYNNIGTPGSTRKGAIYFRGDNIDVINNTIDNNTLGITVLMTSNCDVRNNIITNNEEYGIEVRDHEYPPSENLTIDYNDVWSNADGDYWQVDPPANDISANPDFGYNYQLLAGSPCIDAGDPDPAYNDPDGSRNDMGARYFATVVSETMIVDPSVFYAFELYPYPENDNDALIFLGGDFESGYTVSDIDLGTLLIDNTLAPISAEITTHPGFDGDVLKVTFDKAGYLSLFGILWDETIHNLSLSGDFIDQNSFTETSLVTLIGHISGDVNFDGGLNILDVSYLVNYLYQGGPAPRPFDEIGDVNVSGSIDILDISYIVRYLYKGGPTPQHK